MDKNSDEIKRAFDVLCSSACLVLFAPAFLLIAIVAKWRSPGPVFYCGTRVGRNGRPFKLYKFRSMVVDAETLGGSATANDDPRLTPIGRFLRQYKLDELPQLWNVLKGDMSLVGPRPEVRKYVDQYTCEERALLELRPGITDWASIWNSDEGSILLGSKDPEASYEELIRPTKLRLQLEYLRTRSLSTDLEILAHTFLKLANRSWMPKAVAAYGKPGQATAAIQRS